MLLALIIALALAAFGIIAAICVSVKLADTESDLRYAKGQADDYQRRYYANDRRENFEIEKERKEHESELRIAETEAYAEARVAEVDALNRVELKKYKRMAKHAAKQMEEAMQDMPFPFGSYAGPGYTTSDFEELLEKIRGTRPQADEPAPEPTTDHDPS